MRNRTYRLQTETRSQFINIDRFVEQAIGESAVRDGICLVFVPHTTAAVTINENADPDVLRDLCRACDRLIPSDLEFRHREGNSDAHFKAGLFGSSVTIPVENGRPVLGTWQSIYFCEFDGPRQRTLTIRVIKG
ncbi:YjbQ family protein [candidate division KSB1 bacterium]|nr:YjbQ family protein [candidate division KSB1 bacterium]